MLFRLPVHFCPRKHKSVFANDIRLVRVTLYKHSFLKVIPRGARNGPADSYGPDKEASRDAPGSSSPRLSHVFC